jgi:cyclic pyranopterin phosphate synthase
MREVMPPIDRHGRPLRSLRVSVTDRCNLRCEYCMPEDEYLWLPREDILTFEETSALVDIFLDLGVDQVRITGGEPLLRRDLDRLVRLLADKPRLRDLALTTNGVLLADQAERLKAAGLHRVTVSLDTLRRDRFIRLSRFDALDRVLAGIEAARRAGLAPLKLDTVVLRGVNDDELVDLLEYARSVGAEIRFIEYMDVGGATRWAPHYVYTRREMIAAIADHYGPVAPVVEDSRAPADRYRLPDGTVFGVISSTTEPFCDGCDRSRLTADGIWLLCLYATDGVDLRNPLRRGAPAEALRALIASRWTTRTDQGAVDRLHAGRREAFIPVAALKRDAHLEMHTRGG